jgi:hypothetical protein
VRGMLADWVDFDVAAVHYAYGYDILCSQDRGKNATSVFAAAYASTLTATFDVRVMNITSLTKVLLGRFWFPLRTWPAT